MPRRAKPTLSGQPGQPIGAIAGQVYGAGVDQMAMQRTMPAPQVQGGTPMASNGAAIEPEAAPVDPFEAAMAAAQGMGGAGAGLLNQPTERPQEPITAGLASGPGAGPEAMLVPNGTPAGDMLRRLTAATGDPSFAELARRARA